MKSRLRGEGTSSVDLANVSKRGFWLFLDERELFVSFRDFAWFEDASIAEIADVDCSVRITCTGRDSM